MPQTNCVPKNGSEIAKELGMTRQAVSVSIRKSMKKMYKRVLTLGLANTPFQAALVLMEALNINSNSPADLKEFMRLFDKDTMRSITEDAKRIYNIG